MSSNKFEGLILLSFVVVFSGNVHGFQILNCSSNKIYETKWNEKTKEAIIRYDPQIKVSTQKNSSEDDTQLWCETDKRFSKCILTHKNIHGDESIKC